MVGVGVGVVGEMGEGLVGTHPRHITQTYGRSDTM